MGDYDPQNTTGWKEKGQVETWSPGGNGATTTTYNPPPSSGGPPRVLNPPPTIPKGRTHPGGITGSNNWKNWVKNKIGKYTGYTQHNINNQKLRDALAAGLITENQYKRMGGYDVAQQFPGGPLDVPAVVASSLGYNLAKSGFNIKDPTDINAQFGKYGPAESTELNIRGATGLNPSDLQRYESIVGGHQEVGGMLPGGHLPGIKKEPISGKLNFIGEKIYDWTHPNNQLANGGIASQGGRVPFQNGGLGSLPYPEYYKLPPFSAGNTYTNAWTFPTEEEELTTESSVGQGGLPASYRGYPSYEAWLAAQRGGGDAPGQSPLGLTYNPKAVAKTPPLGVDPSTVSIQEIDDYGTYEPRRGILGLKDKVVDFFSGLGTPRVRGTLGTREKNKPRIPLPAAIASWSRSPFNKDSPNYNPMFEDQLNYLEMQGVPGGYIGRDQGSGLLKYGPESVLAGQNVFSLFGSNNYENQLAKKRAWFENRLNKGKKISWNNYMKTLKEQKTLQYKQKDDKSTTIAKIISPKHHQDVSGGGVGGKGGQGDYTTPSIHRAPKSHTAPSKTGHMGPGGKHYAQGGLAGLWPR